MKKLKTQNQLLKENATLRIQLQEAEETLQAIREGAVDAIVVKGDEGDQVYTLTGEEKVYRQLVENMGEGGVTTSRDGKILFCNQQFSNIIGLPMEKIVGRPVYKFVNDSDRTNLTALLARARNKPIKKRLVFLAADGTSVPARVSANLFKYGASTVICLIIMDQTQLEASAEAMRQISDQKIDLQAKQYELLVHQQELQAQNEELIQTESSLRETEERFRRVLDDTLDIIYRLNVRTGRYDYISPSVERILGFSVNELMAQSPESALAMIHPDDLSAFMTAQTRLNETGEAVAEYRQRNKTGDYRWLSNHMSLSRDDGGRPLFRNGNVRDITENKRADEKIQQLVKDLNRHAGELTVANKEMESFSYSVSHDLRNPLSVIITNIEVVAAEIGAKPGTDLYATMTHITQSVERMAQVITDLLVLSGVTRQTLRVQKVDMGAMARGFFTELQATHANRNVEIQIQPDLMVDADPGLLKILLENLIRNAWKFTSKREVARIQLGTTDTDGNRCYFIRDNGVGFDMKGYDNLFKPFKRLHSTREYKGTGIGLAIAKRIMAKHGGAIWAEGEKDAGATFYFRFA